MTSDLKTRLHEAINAVVSRKRGTFTGTDIANDVMRFNPKLWEDARDMQSEFMSDPGVIVRSFRTSNG